MNRGNVIVVANTKGGTGKSTLSSQVLPLLANNNQDIAVYEIDNNNKTKLTNSTRINFKNLSTKETEDAATDVSMAKLMEDDSELKIIDCGGGDDTKKVLEIFGKYDISGLTYVVPVNDDIEQVSNLKETINLINKNDKDAKIYLALNRCNSLDVNSIKEQFIGIYGSTKYNIEPLIEVEVDGIIFIPTTHIFGVLKSVYGTSISDVLPNAKEAVANSNDTRIEFMKTAQAAAKEAGKENDKEYIKKEFSKLMGWFVFGKDIIELADTITRTNSEFFKG